MKLFGATILRNGIKYDYPFQQCLHSLAGLCDEVVIALGKSEDATESAVKVHPLADKFHIVPTVWDENLRKGGVILSQQTNIAFQTLRERHTSGWIIYLQADEVLSDSDFAKIREDIERADREGCDAVTFRYLHFWQSYERIAYTKRWYAHEIRAFRLDRPIESYGDAQSVRGATKIFSSDVHVFHYGHIREPGAYSRKLRDFHRWWHGDGDIEKVLAKGKSQDAGEPTLRYLGPHASFMQERIAKQENPEPRLNLSEPYGILGSASDWSFCPPGRPQWQSSLKELSAFPKDRVVLLRDLNFWERLCTGQDNLPSGMCRPEARPWPQEFRAILQFSRKGIALTP